MKSLARLLFLLSALTPLAHGQQPLELSPDPPPPTSATTLNVKVRVVEFDALVRDQHGEHIRNLGKESFFVKEDNKLQTIRYFAEDDDLPLTVGLMVDTSTSQIPFVAEERAASQKFFTNMLKRPQDNAFLIRFDTGVYLLKKLTTDPADLEAGLGQLTTPHPPRKGPGGGTLLYDAICSAARVAFPDQHSGRRGRHSLVILTDGDDRGSTHSYDQAIQCALYGNIAVYTIFWSSNDPGMRLEENPSVPVTAPLAGRTSMARLSNMTGGRLFSVSKSMPIDRIYQMIQTDLRHQYRIGYTPPKSKAHEYHHLELKTADKRLKVQTRIGYFAPE